MTHVGDVLIDPDGKHRVVLAVLGGHELQSSQYIRGRREERSAIHVDPELERKQAQQAPQR